MTAIAELTDALIGNGMSPGDAATLVARAIVEGSTKPRTSGAIRTERWRENKRHKTSQNVTSDTTDRTVTVTSQPSQSVTCDAGHIDKKKERKKEKKVSIKTLVPLDWTPSAGGREYARARGFNEQRITTEGERFRNNSHAKGLRYSNIDAAWCNWVTSPYQQQVNGNGKSGHSDTVMDAADRRIAELGAAEGREQGDLGLVDVTPGRIQGR